MRGLDAFEERSSLKTWIFRILANRARTRAVREARQVPFSSLGPDGGDGGPSGIDEDAFEGRRMDKPAAATGGAPALARAARARSAGAIETLPEQQRTVITLRDVAGLEGPEVAELLGISEGNQRVILHRARSRVRSELAGYLAS